MIRQLNKLSQPEYELVMDAPVLVALLVAGADKEIDPMEYERTIRLIHTKSFSESPGLKEIYKELEKNVHERIAILLQAFPDNPESRNRMVSSRLERLNSVFEKMDPGFAHMFYMSLKNMAYYIGTVHHALMGEALTSHKTKELMELPMLNEPQLNNNE